MDANVTACHPRLSLLKKTDFKVDYKNYFESTNTYPYFVVNVRLDWIAVKSKHEIAISNVPILSVGLNTIQTNMSDHKPISARITF